MTQANPNNGYTLTSMDSTDVYNYLKRLARKTSDKLRKDNLSALAEALITCYGDDYDIDTVELRMIVIDHETRLSEADYREMQCHVTTSMRTLSLSEAHKD